MTGRHHGIACSAIVALVGISGCSLFAPHQASEIPVHRTETRLTPAPSLSDPGDPAAQAATAPGERLSDAASSAAAKLSSPEPVPVSLRGARAPAWKIGDQWSFRWESREGQGEYTWTVARTETLDGAAHYVVKTGEREIYFRARDLATSLERRAGVAEIRHTPPRMSFSWPLTPGTMWRQALTELKGPGAEPSDRTIAWTIEREERITVGAGEFDTLVIVARHDHHKSQVMYEMWYAPEAKQWVRLKEHFPSGIRYREMTDLDLEG